MKQHAALLLAVLSVVFCAGCARDIIVSEVLQVSEHTELFTRYNLWYTNPEEMDSRNIQKGTIIPFGTKIEFNETTDKEISFTTVRDGKKFTIKYDTKYRMMPPEDYIRSLVSEEPPEELSFGMPPVDVEKIKRGVIEKGMTKDEVKLAFGPPCAFRTPSESNATWIYWIGELAGKRVIFNGSQVIEILTL